MKAQPTDVPPPESEDDPSSLLSALDAEASSFNKDSEISRVLSAFRLDSYAVLDLQPGCTAADIKNTYRKKSLLIHPDKCPNPLAPDAFDRLKKAAEELADEKKREQLDEAIADARMLLIREKKWTVNEERLKGPEFLAEWRVRTREVLVDNELRRRRQMKGQMREEGREQRRQDVEDNERKRKREHEKDWEQTRDQRIGSWRDFKVGLKRVGDQKDEVIGAIQTGEKVKKKKKMKPIG